MKKILLALMLLFSTSTVAMASETWVFDRAHSKIGFSVSHLVITDVEGLFKSYSGTVKTDDNSFEGSQASFEIDVASIDTDIEKRDNHLKSADFFNADQFPKIIFKSTSFTKVEGNKYKLVGDLTIRDITKPVELDVVYNGIVKNFMGKDKAGFKLMGEINRFDYGLTWNKLMETGGAVVGKTVYIEGNIQLDKK